MRVSCSCGPGGGRRRCDRVTITTLHDGRLLQEERGEGGGGGGGGGCPSNM